ncbi:peptidylprolyl isomerase [Acinetobacter pollinis]|uniref:Peptidyl-prolyl cis-trans isomerase C n=1 Tax=Acinetobacter pollinis TaxID=2605270 RepID=A0ABU6DUD8_9GAMM|nr:peptidylprolyl isomerase [Acinetobacter pollinis]MBF7689271.1 peptidylprolyl isomerase [Acinetobacter pollinis]MBF7691934.1 peptidylprolyl isomerase [Acinetobacter pollinis]MBF7696816.1 peptidylprolyl isomerase [Acinetobacter pollinis]MBF7700039.1 peptidylprolyl isomerase [Acinetobacter pollinis]MEB5476493.1 peptidylprolyl isomerase [Acinetobacter pollinis]
MKTAIVRHILVKDIELAQQLKEKLARGSEFGKLAKQHSTCNSAKRGGELGEVKQGQLVPVIDKLVFSAPEKVIQGPVKSKFGYHLVEVKFRMDF